MATENTEDKDFGALPEFEAEATTPDDIEVEIVEEVVAEAPQEAETEAEEPEVAAEEEEDDETVAEAEDDDEPSDEEYKTYSQRVQARIKREIKLRKKVEAQARTSYANLQNQALQQIQALQQREQQAQSSLTDLQTQYVALLDSSLTTSVSNKQAELRRAKDDGDVEAEIKVLSELQSLLHQKNQVEEVKNQVAARKAGVPAAPNPATQHAPHMSSTGQPNQLAIAWVQKHRHIFTESKYAAKAAAIKAIDNGMAQEGWNPQTPAFYKELDKRIEAEFPGLIKKSATATSTGKKSPVAPVGAGKPTKAGGSNTVKLTRADLENMQRYGLDPNNKEHLKTYARSKIAA